MADFDFTGLSEHHGRLKPERLAKILSNLKDTYPHTRAAAAHGLAGVENPEAVPALTEALNDEVKDVRTAALRSLSEIGSKEAITILISHLRDPRQDVRTQAAHFLGASRALRAAPKIRDALRIEYDVSAKEYMLEALGRMRDDSSLTLICSFLNDRESSVRWSAVWAISMIGRETKSKEALTMLRRLEKHSDRRVQREAATALKMISPKQV